ncbi:MAG: hypothetical protein QM731_06120 [Chitinophagaceae bacterium]
MKKSVATFIAVIVMVASLHAFRLFRQSSLTGRIIPANAAGVIWAINGKDSLKIIPDKDGTFAFVVKPGKWNIIVPSLSGKNVTVNVNVEEGKTMCLGNIELPIQ